MKRLTQKGFRWTSESIFRDIDRWSLAECLNRLSEYEDIDFTPEQIMELKERDTATAAIITGFNRAIGCKVGQCPKCGQMARDYMDFCNECGQRLKWES